MPTPAPPAGDVLRFRRTADDAMARYADARAGLDTAQYGGLAALRARAALTGDRGDAFAGAGAGWDARAGIANQRLAGDEAGWGDWWNLMPNVQYERIQGLGGAGQAAFEAARKKRASRGSGTRSGGYGSAAGSGYWPVNPWDPFATEEPRTGGAPGRSRTPLIPVRGSY